MEYLNFIKYTNLQLENLIKIFLDMIVFNRINTYSKTLKNTGVEKHASLLLIVAMMSFMIQAQKTCVLS